MATTFKPIAVAETRFNSMTLQTWVAVAEIISALAVTFTLIAVIASLRQNTKSQKALAVESLAAAITGMQNSGNGNRGSNLNSESFREQAI